MLYLLSFGYTCVSIWSFGISSDNGCKQSRIRNLPCRSFCKRSRIMRTVFIKVSTFPWLRVGIKAWRAFLVNRNRDTMTRTCRMLASNCISGSEERRSLALIPSRSLVELSQCEHSRCSVKSAGCLKMGEASCCSHSTIHWHLPHIPSSSFWLIIWLLASFFFSEHTVHLVCLSLPLRGEFRILAAGDVRKTQK